MAGNQDILTSYADFAQDPEAVIDKLNTTGEPTIVTSHGRLLFLIQPLDVQPPTPEVTE